LLRSSQTAFTVSVAEENVKKNIAQMTKSLKQVEVDLKNAEQDKTADPSDRFVNVMTISFDVT
jgi:hypothetical protein